MTQEPVAPEPAGDVDRHVDEHGDGQTAPAPAGRTSQSELDLGVVSTGSAAIDRALRPMEPLAESPVSEHADAYEQVLADLTGAMSDTPGPTSTDDDDSTG